MYVKEALLLIALIAGSWALPNPLNNQNRPNYFNQKDPGARIVGGTQAAPGSHPHMAAMITGTFIRMFECGGSIIGRRSILTAGHCITGVYFRGSLLSSLRVIVGTNFWNQGGTHHTIARNVTHPSYMAMTLRNDIGILITDNDIVESALVRRIPLSFSYVSGGVPARLAGWGRTSFGGPMSTALLEIFLETLDDNTCLDLATQAAIDQNINVPVIQPLVELCAYHGPNVGACQGDSGGPLVRVDNGHQIGVVSWGFPCAVGAPDIYVRISAFQSWMQRHVI